MSPSSPAVAKICFNSQCKEPLQDPPLARRKGWRLRSGEIAELCDRCSCTFEQGNFCETYHSDDGGWRNCEACGKRVHCGCIVSITAYVLLDADGVHCAACATKPSAPVSREKEDLPTKDAFPGQKRSKTSAATANSPHPSPIILTLPSAQDEVVSTATSSPADPILLEGRLADAWADARNQLSELSLVRKYSYQQIKHWAMSMSVAQHLSTLPKSAVSSASEQMKAVDSQFQETQRLAKGELEKASKLKTALDISKAKLQFEMTIRANMEMELDEQIAKSSHLSAQLQLDSLRSDLATILIELIAVQAELAVYRAEEDECFETWKEDLFKTREFNVLLARCITIVILLGAKGTVELLKEGGFLNADPPANCLDLKRILSSYPSDLFHDFL
ncbi:uncharacterized protein LOC121986418 [Zingiber officinale]|uniref:uncharacterized protein LOC121986418 n=1 Tax=Zingiber officinale TaxID=94328 RepID=UPI001C4CD4FE|nr:uncharacterized protein LOC121986418 [Zingiber officinale]